MKRCSSLWQFYEDEPVREEDEVIVDANGCLHKCPTREGEVHSYTECVCETGEFAYMGELI